MSWGESFIIRIKVFTVLMALMCPGFLIWMASDTKRQIDSYSWPTAPGVVVARKPKTWMDDKNVQKFYGRVIYQYTVNDQSFTTDLTDFGPGTKRSDAQAALAGVRQYHPGDSVRVFYDPDDPSVGVIENGIPQIHLLMLIGLSVGSVISIFASIFIMRSWLRSYRTPQKPVESGGSPDGGA
jgi:hypothetical protein